MKKITIFFWLILILAFFFRFYELVSYPSGFHIDEVTLGWNAYSILNTGKDETGKFFPLYSKSFGLDRALGNFILTGFSVNLFGLTEFAVRFPFAFFGILTLILLYYFVYELFQNSKIALLTIFGLALSPWHLNIVRASSEASISLFLIILGQFLFLKGVRKNNNYLIWSSLLSFLPSIFFYHSAPFIVVLSSIILGFYFYKNQYKIINFTIIFSQLFLILLVGIFLFLGKGGVNRFSQVGFHKDPSVINEQTKMFYEEGTNEVFRARLFHNKIISLGRAFLRNFTDYYSIKFLFLEPSLPPRYAPPAMGQLYLWELPLFLYSIFILIKKNSRSAKLLLTFLFSTPIIAAITYEYSPNVQRSFFMLPYLIVVNAYGLKSFITNFHKNILVLIILVCIFLLNIFYYLHQYYIHLPVHFPIFRNDGAFEMVKVVINLQNNYKRVIITNHPESPYHYFLFYQKFDPLKYQQKYSPSDKTPSDWLFEDKIFFSSEQCPSKKYFNEINSSVLLIDSGECNYSQDLEINYKIIEEIKRKDGSIVYRLLQKII